MKNQLARANAGITILSKSNYLDWGIISNPSLMAALFQIYGLANPKVSRDDMIAVRQN